VAERFTYYKGTLACQYAIEKIPLAADKHKYPYQGKFRLEPRFRLFDAIEISESEYQHAVNDPAGNWISQIGSNGVELYDQADNANSRHGIKVSTDEIHLAVKANETSVEDNEPHFKTLPLENYLHTHANPDLFHEKGLPFHKSFFSYNDQETGGKITGQALIRVPIKNPSINNKTGKNPDPNDTGNGNSWIKDMQAGCFRPSIWPSLFKSQANGCFGNSGPMAGCFGPNVGAGGCFGLPLNSFGCMPMLGLLLLLSLIAGLLGRNGCNNTTPAPIIIHDTIRVEVRKVDTLKIIQKDTVSFVDSATSIKYETVSLPNVQFVTNSDVLLPSSASDLQQLAEYLIKNDSLRATIYGHTDSIGKPADNIKLSQRRAESVKRFLSSLGVDPQRMEAIGKGDTEPKASNKTEEGRLMNRRVEVKLVKTQFKDTRRIQRDPAPAPKPDPNE
jgi:outer membrane protein OmpA-like peptidoglycan-associated protein